MEGRDGETKWGNFIGYIILPFLIMGCKNPLDYIRRAKATADRKRNSLEAIFTYKGAELIVKCFGIKVIPGLLMHYGKAEERLLLTPYFV